MSNALTQKGFHEWLRNRGKSDDRPVFQYDEKALHVAFFGADGLLYDEHAVSPHGFPSKVRIDR